MHRLHQELPTHLNLEPDSVQDYNETPGVARGTVSSRRHRRDLAEMQSSVGQLLNESNVVSKSIFLNFLFSGFLMFGFSAAA